MSSYEKRQARAERLQNAAARAAANAEQLWNQGSKMADVIPFGQPILVGHHSEKRDRNYRARIEKKFEQAHTESQRAEQLAARAQAAANNTAIFSDDPAAQEKLADRIEQLERRQELMREGNKLVRKNDREGLLDLGFTESQITQLFTPNFMGVTGFESWQLSNNSANIRRLKQRLEQIQAHANDQTQETTIGQVNIVDNVEENRLQLYFPGKPSAELRAELKRSGFRWAPSNGCWQAYRKQWALEQAKQIIAKYTD